MAREANQMTAERFHLGDVLSMTTGKLLSPSGMDGVYKIAQHLAGEPVWTHQLGRVMRESKPHLLAQYPKLEAVTAANVTPENHARWLAMMVETLGQWFDVEPMPADAHESIDPLSELAERVHPDRIFTIGA